VPFTTNTDYYHKNSGPMITSIESKIFFLRERVMLFNDAIDCKVDVAAMAHE